MSLRKILGWAAFIAVVAGGVWLFAETPEDRTRSTYKGPHGTVFVQFDAQHRGVRYGVKDDARSDVTAIMIFPNGVRGYCPGACVFEGYWIKLMYRDKDGERQAIVNDDPKTNKLPSSSR